MNTKPYRAEASFCVVIADEEDVDFSSMQQKIERTLSCHFQWGKYRSQQCFLAKLFGMVVTFDHFTSVAGQDIYVLWGQTDAAILQQVPDGVWQHFDDYEWEEIDINHFLVTLLQSGGCGIWRPRILPQDEQLIDEIDDGIQL